MSNSTESKHTPGPWRHWDVTVTPKLTTYAGTQTFGETTEQVYARSREEAIKKMRRARRDADGMYAVPASYRAVIAKAGGAE
jgi:hypothetical protein